MNKPKMTYFEQEDILHIVIAEGPESSSMELTPNITAELNESNELIGVEILNASLFMRDAVLESVQARITLLLQSSKAEFACNEPDQVIGEAFRIRTVNLGTDVQIDREEMYADRLF